MANLQAFGDKLIGGAASFPPGGTTGQILAKRSAINGDTEWIDAGVTRIEQTYLGAKNMFCEDYIQIGITPSGEDPDKATWTSALDPNFEYILSMHGTNTLDSVGYATIDSTHTPSEIIPITSFPATISLNAGNIGIAVIFTKTNITLADIQAAKFMLRLAVDADDTYAPYAASNYNLTQQVSALAKTQTVRSFPIATTDWVDNTDPTTSTAYPKIASLSSAQGIYDSTSTPLWKLKGANGAMPTPDDYENGINFVYEAFFNNAAIILYATEAPTVALTIEVKGE